MFTLANWNDVNSQQPPCLHPYIYVPWFFALGHTNYAMWIPVHLHDMNSLKYNQPSVL